MPIISSGVHSILSVKHDQPDAFSFSKKPFNAIFPEKAALGTIL
jgi:hypothetical protein